MYVSTGIQQSIDTSIYWSLNTSLMNKLQTIHSKYTVCLNELPNILAHMYAKTQVITTTVVNK